MTTRRDFIRQGALFVAAGALIEPKRLWAFPTNPLGRSTVIDPVAGIEDLNQLLKEYYTECWQPAGAVATYWLRMGVELRTDGPPLRQTLFGGR